jgi:hypothetical protein
MEQVMKHRDGIVASLALALSVTLMAGWSARRLCECGRRRSGGYQALFHVVAATQQGQQ